MKLNPQKCPSPTNTLNKCNSEAITKVKVNSPNTLPIFCADKKQLRAHETNRTEEFLWVKTNLRGGKIATYQFGTPQICVNISTDPK